LEKKSVPARRSGCLNVLDVHLANIPDWFNDRHPNLAGYQVISTQLAGFLAPRLHEKNK